MKPKTIPRWTLIVAVMLIAVALMTGVALARPGGGAMFGAAGNLGPSETANQLDPTILSGGHYQLTSVTLRDIQDSASQESAVASGGGYHLQVLEHPRLTGNGCCCVYLPCILR
jgi:hypothetical protein